MIKDQAEQLRNLLPAAELYPKIASDFHTKRLAITSGKGGVGKSVIAINLALLLAQSERKTLLIDGDINLAKIPILTNTSPEFSYSDVRRGERKIGEVIYEYQPNCSILPTGAGVLELLNDGYDDFSEHFTNQFQQLNGIFDLMLVDTASGISSLVFGELVSCDEVMVVITPEPTAIADAYAIVKILSYYYPEIPLHIVFNMVESKDEANEAFHKFNMIVQKFLHREISFLGFLLQDEQVRQSIKAQKPLAIANPQNQFIVELDKIKEKWLERRMRPALA